MTVSSLFISPHSGILCPDELVNFNMLNDFTLFMESSRGIETIFNFRENNSVLIENMVSKVFSDPDRDFGDIFPRTSDGVIKTETSMKKKVFKNSTYPDEIAISNILQRYYFSFFKKLDREVENRKPSLLVKVHSHMPVYPENSKLSGIPAPALIVNHNDSDTCAGKAALFILEELGNVISKEADTVGEKVAAGEIENSFINDKYGDKFSIIELSVTKSLFINDKNFDLNSLTISQERLKHLSNVFERCFIKLSRSAI